MVYDIYIYIISQIYQERLPRANVYIAPPPNSFFPPPPPEVLYGSRSWNNQMVGCTRKLQDTLPVHCKYRHLDLARPPPCYSNCIVPSQKRMTPCGQNAFSTSAGHANLIRYFCPSNFSTRRFLLNVRMICPALNSGRAIHTHWALPPRFLPVAVLGAPSPSRPCPPRLRHRFVRRTHEKLTVFAPLFL